MKTLFILASVMVLLFLAAPNQVEAQSKQPKSTLPEITDVRMPEALAQQIAKDDDIEKNKSCQMCYGDAKSFAEETTRSIDLNGDGNPEYLMSNCGNRTCSGWIYREVAGKYEMLFAGYMGDVSSTHPLATVSNGYRDLRNDESDYTAIILKYDGRHYKRAECLKYKVIYKDRNSIEVLRRTLISRGPCPK